MDPAKITTFISLAGAAIWAIAYVAKRSNLAVTATMLVTLAAMGTAAALEFRQHVDRCASVPMLRINEVCAEGKQCQGGKDFVELLNPSATADVDLSCYAISSMRDGRNGGPRMEGAPVLLTGAIEPGGVFAWEEDELRFRLSWKKGDRVTLFKLKLEPGQPVVFVPVDRVAVDKDNSYRARDPKTGQWRSLTNQQVGQLTTAVGSLGEKNGPWPR